MAKPTDTFTWATSGSAEITKPSADKTAIGYAGNEEVPAGFWNWTLYVLGAWITWLATHGAAAWRYSLPSGATAGSCTQDASSGFYGTTFNAAGSLHFIPVHVTAGETITDIGATYTYPTDALNTATLKLYKIDAAAGGAPTLVDTLTLNGRLSSGTATSSHTLGAPEVVAAGESYFFHFDVASSNGTFGIGAVGVKLAEAF